MIEGNSISLFSGMGGDTLGMEQAGLNIIGYSEKEKVFQKTHELNFENSKLIGGDITKIKDETFVEYKNKIKMIFAGFPCFIAGTKVLTNEGYKNIEDVNLDNTLMTHTGKFQKIINLQRKIYNGILYKIQAKYHTSFTTTERHPFYVREKQKIWNNKIRKYDYIFKEAEWKRAQNLTNNDYFGMKINQNRIIPEFNFDDIGSIKLDDVDMWFMMGYHIGNGCLDDYMENKKTNRRRTRICFCINEKHIELVLNKCKKIVTFKFGHYSCKSGKASVYTVSNKLWFNILKKFGKYAHGKLIPEWVQDAPKEYIEHFIDGYRTADGCIKKNEKYSFTTVSYNLAFGLQRLYLKLGHLFSINKFIRPKTTIIEGRTVNQRDTYQIEGYVREKKREYSSFIEDGYAWFAPFKMEKIEIENEPVFNFEVENDNSYCVENIVASNCQGYSNAGKKDPNDPRNSLFIEFVRATKCIKPDYIIGENVKGLLTKKTGSGDKVIDVIVKEFENIGYDIKYQVFKTEKYGVPQKRERLLIVGVKKELNKEIEFPEELKSKPDLLNIVKFDMTGTIKINEEEFKKWNIPEECILKNMDNSEEENNVHPYLKVLVEDKNPEYKSKTYDTRLSFSKRGSPIHGEIIDIRKPSKTIICTYNHQPRLFVPLKNKNGYYLRCLLPIELKQIQGFPEDYKIEGNLKEQIVQIGNAVPPPLIKQIVEKLISL
jgi:DNA (cytosine-5)-methyltransferase 1